MGSKPSSPVSPVSGDSDSPTRQLYSTTDRSGDPESPVRQMQQERSLMERAEISLQGLIYSNSSNLDIQRVNRGNGDHIGNLPGRFSSSVDTVLPSRSGERSSHPGTNRSYSTDSPTRGGAPAESTSSSISSSGLSHFLSNFNLWRASGSSTSDRQRAQSLSHMPEQVSSSSGSHPTDASQGEVSHGHDSEEFSFSNPRAVLSRLLSPREGHGVSPSDSSQRRDTFSFRDLTFSSAQEFLAEATLNGLGRVYVTHSLPSHMWAVNGIQHYLFFALFTRFLFFILFLPLQYFMKMTSMPSAF